MVNVVLTRFKITLDMTILNALCRIMKRECFETDLIIIEPAKYGSNKRFLKNKSSERYI